MKKIDGIIFDIDGTIVSSNELIFASFNFVTEKYLNKKLTTSEIISLFGPTEDQIIDTWFGDSSESVKEDYYKFYSDNHTMAEAYSGIEEVIKYIKSKNILLSIYTGKGRNSAFITLNKLNLMNYFDMIVTGDDVVEHKPSAEGILKFINQYNLEPKNILMIGDAPADIKAARAAGVKVASVVWDSYAKETVLTMKSDFIFNSVEELKIFLEHCLN
ncbi:MAG: phosphatase [Chlorobiaceae bacterium]|nr:phosphatase [Chlorobiaceae bacterium]MBA4309885.1 phosphatase [Chlorobiaceae bacterium]